MDRSRPLSSGLAPRPSRSGTGIRRPHSRPPPRLRRACLAALALTMANASSASGCAASFDPASEINSLRVLAVVPDKPYAAPGDEVAFTMTYVDAAGEEPRPVQITWLGGCFDPEGDQYFGCYAPLQQVFEGLARGTLPPEGLVAQGVGLNQFTLKLPEDIVSRRPVPEVGPHYGIAYLFFAACAGKVDVVPQEGSGAAGSFPLGCFDAEGRRLGAESFVPGYTQIYVFADGRTNKNPIATGINLDGAPISEDFGLIPEVKRCAVREEDREVSGCGAKDPTAECTTYDIQVVIPEDVAELDADSTDEDGNPLRESVWVNYYADAGDFSADIKLISDPVEGFIDDQATTWLPPDAAGPVHIWAVVHDARGGASVVERYVRVVD